MMAFYGFVDEMEDRKTPILIGQLLCFHCPYHTTIRIRRGQPMRVDCKWDTYEDMLKGNIEAYEKFKPLALELLALIHGDSSPDVVLIVRNMVFEKNDDEGEYNRDEKHEGKYERRL